MNVSLKTTTLLAVIAASLTTQVMAGNNLRGLAVAGPKVGPLPPAVAAAFGDSNVQSLITLTDSYPSTSKGEAELTILKRNGNIQKSNYGANAFILKNTGDKNIVGCFIDATGAMFSDSVFDNDGTGGDSASKVLTYDSGASTVGAVSTDSYTYLWLPARDKSFDGSADFDPTNLSDENNLFVDETSNTGKGSPKSGGGFRGELLLFNDFNAGEQCGFSGDMDPNSLAGLGKSSIDSGADWDVGGVSGSELIGSVVSILFADGSTASSTLASDGSNSGAIAVLHEDGIQPAPFLTVNGAAPGGSGTYNGNPAIMLTARGGSNYRISMAKGFDAVVNTQTVAGGNISINDLVAARLAAQYPEFPVNNVQSWQHKEAAFPLDGSVDVSSLFDVGNDKLPIAWSAVIIDESGKPLSETTAPIRLVHDSPTMESGPTNAPTPSPTAPTPSPTDAPEVDPLPPGCGYFHGCYLYDTHAKEIIKELKENEIIPYDLNSADGFSVHCHMEDQVDPQTNEVTGTFNRVDFTYPGGTYTDWKAPHFMNGDAHGAEWVVPVTVLKTPGLKEVTVQGELWGKKVCFTKVYHLEPSDELATTDSPMSSPSMEPTASPTAAPTPSPTSAPTNSPTTASPTSIPSMEPTASPLAAPTPSPTSAPTNSPTTASPTSSPVAVKPRSDENKPDGCGLFQGCFLYNTHELTIVKELKEGEVTLYSLDEADGFSVLCTLDDIVDPTTNEKIGTFNRVDFTYPGDNWTDWAAPHFMSGNKNTNGALWVVPVKVLNTEGPKEITVEGGIWTGTCFTKTYQMDTSSDIVPPCDKGRKLDKDGYCVKDWCNDNFQCPEFSSRKLFNSNGQLRECFNNFNDCTCDDGYHKSGNKCVKPKPDDGCDRDRKRDGSGFCVMEWCDHDFQCPDHSSRRKYSGKSLRKCFNNFDDCECDNGYTKSGEKCVEEKKDDGCGNGRKRDGSGYCVKEWCDHDFQCPANSSRIQFSSGTNLRNCFNNFDDCKCDDVFVKSGDDCVKEEEKKKNTCEPGRKLDGSGYCVKNWCDHDYHCPSGMKRKSNRECYNNKNDCKW